MTTGYPNKDCHTQLKTWLGEFPLWLLPSLLILRPSPSSRMLELQEGPNWEFPECSSRFAAWLTASLHPQGNAVGKHFPPEGCRSSLLWSLQLCTFLVPLSLPPYFTTIINCDTEPGVTLPLKGYIWWGTQTPLNRSVGEHLSGGGHRQTLPTPERRQWAYKCLLGSIMTVHLPSCPRFLLCSPSLLTSWTIYWSLLLLAGFAGRLGVASFNSMKR